MKISRVLQSTIVKEKSQFFFYRICIYSAFAFFYSKINLFEKSSLMIKGLILIPYFFFMTAQWFLLGKEIDHRLKIYYRVTSSIDRLIYRIVLGNFFFIIIFNIFFYIDSSFWNILFWLTWPILGIFYSWPTRGKIIEESLSIQLSELRFLDSFEKTVLFLILLMFLTSIPYFPKNQMNLFNLRFLDGGISIFFWNFLKINYLPFLSNKFFFNLAKLFHFYFYGFGLFMLSIYGVIRFFLTRKLALLATFAAISSWGIYKMVVINLSGIWDETFYLLWIWSFFWMRNSATYRSGLFWGVVSILGFIFDRRNIDLFIINIVNIFFAFRGREFWFKTQVLKYYLFGIACLALIAFMDSGIFLVNYDFGILGIKSLLELFQTKAFFYLAILGLPLCIFKFRSYLDIALIFSQALFLGVFLVGKEHSSLWILPLCFLSVLPIDAIFVAIGRMRSKKNVIYVIYILIILLDSHFEGRVKNLLNYFKQ